MKPLAFQDYFPDDVAICYGCGRNNPKGLQIKSYWEADEGICRFLPESHHTAFPKVVYGGLIASLIDCHSICTAMAHAYRLENPDMTSAPDIYFVTAELNVRFLKPTPTETELVLRAHVTECETRKSYVHCSVFAQNIETARGKVLAVRVPSYRP
ncbi:MAG: PaaI family thioesterase [Candidatus Magnetomorum sp.]|nr:PaaI family thioesterase [Candidatus Magnetomorum sp.]